MEGLDFRNRDGLGLAHRNATLAAAALVATAYHDAIALLLIDFHRANADAFAADLALLFVKSNNVHTDILVISDR
jgi:hypothetical protein